MKLKLYNLIQIHTHCLDTSILITETLSWLHFNKLKLCVSFLNKETKFLFLKIMPHNTIKDAQSK